MRDRLLSQPFVCSLIGNGWEPISESSMGRLCCKIRSFIHFLARRSPVWNVQSRYNYAAVLNATSVTNMEKQEDGSRPLRITTWTTGPYHN